MPCRTLLGVLAGLALLTLGLQTDVNAAFAQNAVQNFAPAPEATPATGANRGLPPAPEEPGRGADEIGNPRLLPPRAILSSLANRGYRKAAIKRVRGDSYIVEAEGSEGGRVLIVVDGHTTEITGLRQLGWARPPRQWDNESWVPPRPWSGPRW